MWTCTSILELLLFIILNVTFSCGNFTIDCDERWRSCLMCKTTGCVKCPTLIVFPSRECVTECPRGYTIRWSTLVDYMGKVCIHSGYLAGLTAEAAAVLVGICTGAIICIIIICAGILYIRYKRKHRAQSETPSASDIEDSPERRDFLKQIETLRPHAPTFLAMLNDTRRQIRELHGAGDNAAITAYRPVVRDLAKILFILNRTLDRISMVPDDWDHLFSWAEKTLKRYKRMSEISQPQVAQLVSFLQTPVHSSDTESLTFSQTLSTFKPERHRQCGSGSTLSLQDIAVKNFHSNYDCHLGSMLNPQWNFNYSLVNPSPVPATATATATAAPYNTAAAQWQDNRHYLNSSYLLEDDFFQFGFRPQDEITTEL